MTQALLTQRKPTPRQLEIAREWQDLCDAHKIPPPMAHFQVPGLDGEDIPVWLKWMINGADISLSADYEKYNGMHWHLLHREMDHMESSTLIYPNDVQWVIGQLNFWANQQG